MNKPKLPLRLKDPYRMPNFIVGDVVRDDLTYQNHVVLEVLGPGTSAYRLDSDYVGGLRHAWEVSLPFDVWEED